MQLATKARLGASGRRRADGSLAPWRTVAAAALALIVLGPFVLTAQQASARPVCATPVDTRNLTEDPPIVTGTWTRTRAPDFPVGTGAIKTFSVTLLDESIVFAENGQVVMRSLDGGCSWTEVFRLPELPGPDFPFSANDSEIIEVTMPTPASVPPSPIPIVYVTIEQLKRVSRPHVIFTGTGGDTWELAAGLEDAVGRPTDLSASLFNATAVYLLTDVSGVRDELPLPDTPVDAPAAGTMIHRSFDAGVTFGDQPMTAPGLPSRGIEIDPFEGRDFWVYGDGGLFHGQDTAITQVPGIPTIGALDVFPVRDKPSRVIAFESDGPVMHRSDDGVNFITSVTPGTVQSSASFDQDNYVVTTSTGVYLHSSGLVPGLDFVDVSQPNHPVITDLGMILGRSAVEPFSVVGHTGSTLERWDLKGQLPQPPEFQPIDVILPGGTSVTTDPPVLAPNDRRIVLEPGEKRAITYTLDLPKTPTPLDVYFLVDVSGSMQGAINGTASAMADIVSKLQAERINAYFGVGEYRSYTDDPAYHMVRDMGEPDEELAVALENLRASGGGEETQLEALYQSATGTGRFGVNLFVEDGQDVTWRPQSLRVVLHASDEPISTGPPHPAYEEVVAALNADDADHIGIAIQGSSGFSGTPKEGMDILSAGTGAVAPTSGVDCDGDLINEIPAGDPLVCVIDPGQVEEASAMSTLIVNLLKALEDRVPVKLVATGGKSVVKTIAPDVIPDVNLKSSNVLKYEVIYSCPSVLRETKVPVELVAEARGQGLDTVNAMVVCSPPDPPVPAIPPVVALIPLVLPPPAPPQIGPNPQPNPQPQGQPQGQAQGAFAAQEEQQPQLAYVQAQQLQDRAAAEEIASNRSSGERQYQMSRYSDRPRDVPPEVTFLIGAAAMSLMYGCVTLARGRVQVEHVSSRRRTR
ncbi:MAG TPA: vWA domain-containing protein [Actinomycetota bacterium]|nr:vWA domain-containing protein [Actinomycetota bacterium]